MPNSSVADLPMEAFGRVARDLELRGAWQLGYVVDDLEKASRTLGPRLGVKSWYKPRIIKQKLFFEDLPIEQKLEIAVGYAGGVQVELVQGDPRRHSLFESVPADGDYVPHHIGFFLRSVAAHQSRLAAKGLHPVQYGSIWFAKRHRTRVAYFDARASMGCVIELIEHRVQGCYIGMPRWYVMLGALTGKVERL